MSEQITITCPHCGHSKTVPASMIPANVTNANCPVCKQLFSLAENLRVHDAVPLDMSDDAVNAKTCGQDQVDMQPDGDAGSTPPPLPDVPAAVTTQPPPLPTQNPQNDKPRLSRQRLDFEFTGTAREYFGIWIVNTLLKFVTAGIYTAWAKVRMRRFFYGSTRLQGHVFEYLADPKVLFKGWLIAVGAFLIYMLASQIDVVLGAIAGMALFCLLPWLIVRSRMFNNRNSSYRNIRFGFKPAYREAYIVYAGLPLLSILTLGLLTPYVLYRQKKFLTENSSYGKTPFTFNAKAKDFYILALKVFFGFIVIAALVGAISAMLLGGVSAVLHPTGQREVLAALGIIPILAFILIYFLIMVYGQTAMANLCWNNIKLAGNSLESRLSMWSMAYLFVTNALAILFSLGLLMPWAMVRMTRYRMETLTLISDGSIEDILADSANMGVVGAAGEEIGDVFDMPVDIAL